MLIPACAVVEPPSGGPEDRIRPHLAVIEPDSGMVDLGSVEVLNFTFSEKMDRTSAVSWLHFFPDQRIRKTKWHGATRAEVVLEQALPADTVIVVEVAAGMRDAHKVANKRGRRFPLATADTIPTGRISGVLVLADSAVTNGVVELWAVPPDTLEYFQQDLLRRTVTDNTGAYTFDWLPVPGGPWLARGFADANGDLRPGEKEAQRLLPDTLSLSDARTAEVVGVTTLYPWNTPGRLMLAPFAVPDFAGRPVAWSMAVTENDTGWVPVPLRQANFAFLTPDTVSTVAEVKAGVNRLVVFIDVDGDSTFSGVPDSLLGALPDSVRAAIPDSVLTPHFLEPWLMVDEVEVLPGLDADLTLPDLAAADVSYTLTPWTPPLPGPEMPDSLPDSLTAPADTLVAPPPTNEKSP